jgi:putative ABC transport system permease protein
MPEELPTTRPEVVLRMALRAMAGHRLRSFLTVTVVGLSVAAIVASTGRTDATRRTLLLRLEDPSARLVRIIDRDRQGNVGPDSVTRLAALGSVDWAIGLGPAGPLGRNSALGGPREGYASDAAGVRQYWGDLESGPLVRRIVGRVPLEGESVAGEDAVHELGLADGVGTVDAETLGPLAVVGTIRVAPAVRSLGSYVLVRGSPDGGQIAEVLVLVRSSAQVESLVESLPAILATDQASLAVERAAALLSLRQDLSREVGELDGAVLLGSLATGSLLVGAISYGAIEQRRREFGIRRAQGATRSTIAALVVIESALMVTVGGGVGGLIGSLAVLLPTGTIPDPELTLAAGILVAIAGVAGCVPPALIAAFRQPLYVLRSA